MPIKYQKWIERSDLHNNPEDVYIFGDNYARQGLCGQAKAMRGEPNALGIATKRTPYHNNEDAYFSDDNFFMHTYSLSVEFGKANVALKEGKTVVIPSDGIGTGLSKVPEKAPQVHTYIEMAVMVLERRYGMLLGVDPVWQFRFIKR